jgi:hypothetical protein
VLEKRHSLPAAVSNPIAPGVDPIGDVELQAARQSTSTFAVAFTAAG